MNHNLQMLGYLFVWALLALTACATIVPTPTPNPSSSATPPQPPENTPARQPSTPTANAPVNSPTNAANPPATKPSFAPAPGDDKLQRGNIFLDASRLLSTASFPPQLFLELAGSLPTPCHQLRVQVPPPNAQNQIRISVYSLADPSAMCVQMLAPFNANVSLGNLAKGKYTVWVNDKQIGEFTVP